MNYVLAWVFCCSVGLVFWSIDVEATVRELAAGFTMAGASLCWHRTVMTWRERRALNGEERQ